MTDLFKGPLGTHRSYIAHIALENFMEYARLVAKNEEAHGNERGPNMRWKELRYFLNAAVSFNAIPEYLYFDTHTDWTGQPTVDEFRKALLAKHPFLQQVADIANAYKHAVRGRPQGKKWRVDQSGLLGAKDLGTNEINVQIKLASGERPKIDIDYRFEGIDVTEKAMDEAFRFWVGYLNDDFQINVVAVTREESNE